MADNDIKVHSRQGAFMKWALIGEKTNMEPLTEVEKLWKYVAENGINGGDTTISDEEYEEIKSYIFGSDN